MPKLCEINNNKYKLETVEHNIMYIVFKILILNVLIKLFFKWTIDRQCYLINQMSTNLDISDNLKKPNH